METETKTLLMSATTHTHTLLEKRTTDVHDYNEREQLKVKPRLQW